MSGTNVTHLAGVDSSPDPDVLIRALDGLNALPGLRIAQATLAEELGIEVGYSVLDAGCGAGEAAVQIARCVGPAGRVTGIDTSPAMLAEANRRTAELGLPITFRQADIRRLPFDAGTFDISRAETVLQHLAEPEQAVAELVRVTRAGGRVGLLELDLGTTFLDVPDGATARIVLDAQQQASVQPQMGRRLGRLLVAYGLSGVRVRTVVVLNSAANLARLLQPHVESLRVAGRLDDATCERWHKALSARDAFGQPAGGAVAFIAVGVKPTAD